MGAPHRERSKARPAAAISLAFACGLALPLATSCATKDATVTRTVRLHAPATALPSDAAYGLFVATGDFDPATSDGKKLADVGAQLSSMPSSSRALVLDVSDGDREWRGARLLASSGDIDLLLWPFQEPAALSADLGAREGSTLAPIDAARALLVGGSGDPIPATFFVDLATGAVTALHDGLLVPRTRAAVSAFGGGALVAGGARADGSLLDSAEVFVAAASGVGDFDHALIALSSPRADHASVALVGGETLLVGGRSDGGGAMHVLSSLEIVDPSTRTARTQGLVSLDVARAGATALRLASGEILVAGGVDDAGNPVPTLEWLAPDAHAHTRRSRDLVARKKRAFIALPGGGALAVIVPDAGDSTLENVWVISADGVIEAATPLTNAMTDAALFDAPGGAPALWTGASWMRWSPWSGQLVPLGDVAQGPPSAARASPEKGLALWLDGSRVTGFRFEVASSFATFAEPLLVVDTSFFVPDRLVSGAAGDPWSALRFDATNGLVLSPGATALLADETYASFALDFDAPTGAPPDLVLRDDRGVEVEIGGATCPFSGNHVHVERSGASLVVNGAVCVTPLDAARRVVIGLRGSASQATRAARVFRVVRR